MKLTRIRTKEAARRYVARNVAAMLDADFTNGSEWMHQHSFHGEDGNLAGSKSEELVHQAARELSQQLHAFGRGKR